MYDTIVIGQGPAGITASIYAARREMKTLIIGKEPGGQIIWANEIENYPGFVSISNFDLINRFNEHALHAGVEIKNCEVKRIETAVDGSFILHTDNEQFQTKTVIITMGLAPRRLSVPGEAELTGKGVSYCANCDGPLFKGKTVAVVGNGNCAFDAAEMLSKIAAKVYLLVRSDVFKAFDTLIEKVKNTANVTIITKAKPQMIKGENKVEAIVYNDENENPVELPVDGIFAEVGRIASTDLVKDYVDLDEKAQILVDKKQATKTPGIYAAGDVVSGEFKQITIAMGQATIAALSAYQYLQTGNFKFNEEVK